MRERRAAYVDLLPAGSRAETGNSAASQRVGRELAGIVLPVTGAAVVNNLLGSASSVLLPQRLMLSGMSRTEALSELGVISGMAMPLLIFPIALISSVCTVLMPEVSRAVRAATGIG